MQAHVSVMVHYWSYIDKCISKNIFVGIMTSNGSTDNYVGRRDVGVICK